MSQITVTCTCDLCGAEGGAPVDDMPEPIPEGWALLAIRGPYSLPDQHDLAHIDMVRQSNAAIDAMVDGLVDMLRNIDRSNGKRYTDDERFDVDKIREMFGGMYGSMRLAVPDQVGSRLRRQELHVCPSCQQGPLWQHLEAQRDVAWEAIEEARAAAS